MQNMRSQLRKSIIAKRSSLTSQQQQHASNKISKIVYGMTDFLLSKRIAFYFAAGGEVTTLTLLETALTLGKECFLPILHPVKHNELLFGRYELGDCLTKNHYGILEPDLHNVESVPPWSLDLVFTPLVAFDCQGNRLGMGGGYYDRTFSFLCDTSIHKPKLIGLAYDFQRVPNFDAENWDVPLHAIVTENQIYSLK